MPVAPGAEQPVEAELLSTGDPVAADLIDKANAGAQLFYAIYHHPKAAELLREFGTRGLVDAYAAAADAYGPRKR
ncbi:hypothetical protein [Micromonospora profundi]|uniref:hypothetical protein n=1 Tax=Micromonospora profundi TaxID=1420889 RepID=UPI0036536263